MYINKNYENFYATTNSPTTSNTPNTNIPTTSSNNKKKSDITKFIIIGVILLLAIILVCISYIFFREDMNTNPNPSDYSNYFDYTTYSNIRY